MSLFAAIRDFAIWRKPQDLGRTEVQRGAGVGGSGSPPSSVGVDADGQGKVSGDRGAGFGLRPSPALSVDPCRGPQPESGSGGEKYFTVTIRPYLTQAMAHDDGAPTPTEGGDSAAKRIAAELRAYPEVRWDRFIEYGGRPRKLRAYGWLPRDDGRADFLLLDFDAVTGALTDWITSYSRTRAQR